MKQFPIVVFLFATLVSTTFAQAYKKEFNELWKSNEFEKQSKAINLLADVGDAGAAKLLTKSLNGLAKKQTILEAEIEKKLGEVDSDLAYGDPKRVKVQEQVIQLSELIADFDKIYEVAEKAIAKFKDPKAIKHLAKEALKGKSLNVKVATMLALGELDDENVTKTLIKALKDKSPQVRQLGVEALKKRTPPAAFEPLLKLISDKAWQVRAATAETLASYADKRAIAPLIEQLKKEKGRLLNDIDSALEALTGESHSGNYTVWRLRLKSEGDKWGQKLTKVQKEKKEPKSRFDRSLRGTTFYYSSGTPEGHKKKTPGKKGEPVIRGGNVISQVLVPDSERLVYILDISGSMNEKAPAGFVKEATKIGGKKMPKSTTKMEVLITRFNQELPKLQPHQNFTIIIYNHQIHWWKKQLVPATKANISAAQNYVKEIRAINLTNTYGAIEAAFKMAGRGSFDKNYDKGVDTIILVSDGLPSTGKYIVQFGKNDKGELREKTCIAFLDSVIRLNKLRRIRINCVGIPPIPMDDLLGGLAADHGGSYVYWQLK